MRIHKRLKVVMCAVALTASVILTPLYTFAAVDSTSGVLGSSFAPKNVMVNIKDADVRDVLSAIAMNMGYNVVYTGPAETISINLDNLSPSAAFDYILKTLDLTYLQEGSTYIVGDRATLQDNFSSSLALTRFSLRYVTPEIMSDMIAQLRLPVTVITLNNNTNSLWIQGFPSDIAKVRELVNVMDIVDNSEDPVADEDGINGKSLTPIKLSYLNAYEFRLLLQSLGIDYSVSLLDDGNRIYLYATPEELETVLGIKDTVDQKNIYLDEGDGVSGFAVLTAYDMVSKQTAISAIGAVCTGLSVVSADNRSTAFILVGDPTEISKAKELMRKLNSNAEDLNTTFFTYKLNHITAAEADRRLQGVTFGDNVVWYITTHADFSGTIFVYCSVDYQDQIRDLISDLDAEYGTLATDVSAMPVYIIKSDNQSAREDYADGMIEYLDLMLSGLTTKYPITRESFSGTNITVLYMSSAAPVEAFELVEAMLARIGESTVSGETANTEELTIEAWWTETGQTGTKPASVSAMSQAQLQSYVLWLAGKIGTGGSITPTLAPLDISGYSLNTYEASLPTTSTTPHPDETPTPLSADEEAFNSAKASLDWLFYDGGIVSDMSSETTVDTVYQAAVRETDGIAGVTLRLNPSVPSSYIQPTETEQGRLTVSIILEVGGYWEVYDVELVLPKTPSDG